MASGCGRPGCVCQRYGGGLAVDNPIKTTKDNPEMHVPLRSVDEAEALYQRGRANQQAEAAAPDRTPVDGAAEKYHQALLKENQRLIEHNNQLHKEFSALHQQNQKLVAERNTAIEFVMMVAANSRFV